MAFIRSKQIKLGAAGDLLIGGVDGAGSILARGTSGQVLKATAGGLEYAGLTAAEIARGGSNVGADLTANEALISAIIASAGLDTEDGSLAPFTGANYIDGSETLREALVDLDTALKSVADSAASNTFTNTGEGVRALASTTVNAAINEAVAKAVVANTTNAAPTVTADETAGYKIGDLWVFGSQIYIAESVAEGAAVWSRIDNGAATDIFRFKGSLDASTDTLPTGAATGDTYRISVAGNFGGVGPTVAVGDYIVWNGSTWDKLDNNDPAVAGTADRITVTGNADLGYTVNIAATYAGQTSITTVGTIGTGTWEGTAIDTAHGGTGLTTIGTAGQFLRVNAGGTALEYADVDLDITELKDSDGVTVASSASGTLEAVTGTVAGDDDLAYTTKGYVDDLVAGAGHVRNEEDFAVPATPGANYAVTLAAAPLGLVAVYFNGLKLLKTGFTVAGTTVTLVDSVNGYAAEEGDVISVSYDRAPA